MHRLPLLACLHFPFPLLRPSSQDDAMTRGALSPPVQCLAKADIYLMIFVGFFTISSEPQQYVLAVWLFGFLEKGLMVKNQGSIYVRAV